MVDCLVPLLHSETFGDAGMSCSPTHSRFATAGPSASCSSSASALVPLVEMLVFSRDCGALILSPCRIRSVIEERKNLYHLKRIRKTSKNLLSKDCSKALVNGKLGVTPKKPVKLDDLLGCGGFGTVFKSNYSNTPVAIKQLHHRRHSSFNFWSLCAELNAFRLPHSPNVVSPVSFILSDPYVQIVTELVCGRDLQKFIYDDRWEVNSGQRKAIALQIAKGLAHCHSHYLLHLDVKPSNVLLSEDFSTCKLTDFGCSRIGTRTKNDILIAPDSTSTSSFGTIAYKAPELLRGDRPTDRADVYSYSILLYELLSRRSPYQGLHPHTIIFLVASSNLRPDLSDAEQWIHDDGSGSDLQLLDLIEKCWVSDHASRPRTGDICDLLSS